MDGLPTELAKLCHLASMAECGDHIWSGPALGAWTAAWLPVAKLWTGWRSIAREILDSTHAAEKLGI
jgi:hypothetical protein